MEEKPLDQKINRYIFLSIIIIFGLLLYYSLSQFFTAFLGAVIFYILSRRLMDRLVKKRGWKRTAAAVYVMFISVIIIMVPIFIISYLLYMKGKYYLANPDLMVQSLHSLQDRIQHQFNIAVLTEENIAGIKAKATGAISSLLNEGLNFFGTITMLYFFLYFMLININRMEAAIVFYLPFKREKIELFGKELVNLTFSNSVGVPAIAVAQGLCGYIGYLIAGVPEAGFWAVITAFSSIVPLIGTALVWLPVSVYLFTMGHSWQGSFLLVWGLIVLGLTDNVVRFVLAKKMADVHPIITVLGVIMGIKYFGISGLVFGPVLISYFIILLKLYYLEFQSGKPAVQRKRTIPVRFNLPFLGQPTKRKKVYHESDRSRE
ncbi:AI-2E family transporter [Segetibacter sp. 3557_3]|uniref:AI-2E family transporter n=1 Tax=Segetibacter sp. 3557_3 TaxID=2547429 RepID=UPI001058A571|nr:AI-2E family transporter [Segetibacter sp. 3557_3]TDH23010.1 AI-2E family transporter [Segetibacter sp. 3557_3]